MDEQSLELVSLCTTHIELGERSVIGDGPSGHRIVAEISSMRLVGERLNASLKGRAAADWLSIVDGVAKIDVRATLQTDDGAIIYLSYVGRCDASDGMQAAPIYTTVSFETSDERYRWLNAAQVVGKGYLQSLKYEWYELR